MTLTDIAPSSPDKATRSALLLAVARHVLEASETEGALAEQVFALIREQVGADVLFVHRMEPDGTLRLVGDAGLPDDLRDAATRLQLAQVLCSQVAASREPLVADEALIALLAPARATDFLRRLAMRSYACHPLLGRDGGILGTFAVASSQRDHFAVEDVEFLQTTSHFLALAWDRHRTEGTLRHREEQLGNLLESISDAFFAIDRGWRFTYLNGEAERLLGHARHEVLGKGVWDVFPDAVGTEFHRNYQRALADGVTVRFEAFYPPHERWYAVTAYPSLEGLSVYFRDVTETTQAGQTLQRTRERLELAQQVARIGTFEWDMLSNAVLWSPELEALYGLRPGGFGGTYAAWAASVHPDDLREAEERIREALSSRGFEGEWRAVWPDGSVRWLAGRGQVFTDEAGRPQRMVGVNIDITERKRAEEALRAADRRKDEFLATLAHELRNPLAPVRTGLQILRLSPPGAPPAATAIETMDRQVTHMVRLIDDLLDVSRISRGKIELKCERLALRSVLDHAVEASRPCIDAGRHELRLRVPAEPLYLHADLTRLAQVVGNLLNNAAKYTPDGGCIELAAAREGDEAVIRVRDNGMGIPPEMLPQVFEMFTQIGRTLDQAQGGLGIGLSISQSLVEMHGGRIEAQSAGIGQGAVFTVRLPLAQDPRARSGAAGARQDASRDGRRKVLVVDDNTDAADTLAMMLDLLGHDTRTAHGGPAALALAREFAPDIVFCDIGMPGMNGYEVARRYRDDPALAPALLVALTGWGSEDDKRRATEAGFDFHLTKPADLALVQDLIARGGTPGRQTQGG
ncbi:ATP-binding protein [Caldimonas tepidiphila]|uniref:hybrid sensor histidine kinase/response regulator n=1 Tax=Caldimonas tepidiphila TaxID=2315841 RepID=UPI000E5A9FBD|nr:ATP-binding protein [Caldimonas tepidiphila]